MKIPAERSLIFGLSICYAISMTSCIKKNSQNNQLNNVGSIAEELIPTPKFKPIGVLDEIQHAIIRESYMMPKMGGQLVNQRSIFQKALLTQIMDSGGIPRSSLSKLTSDIVSDDKGLCAGALCSVALNLKSDEVDTFLDDMHAAVVADKTLVNDQKLRALLLGSLKSDKDAGVATQEIVTIKESETCTDIFNDIDTFDQSKSSATSKVWEGQGRLQCFNTISSAEVNCALQIAAKKYVFNFSEDFDHRADAIWNSANLPKETVSQDMQISGTLGKFRMTATKTDFNLSFIP